MWTSAPVTRWGGASRWSKACSTISAERLAPTPPCGQPSSTITTWLVFATDAWVDPLGRDAVLLGQRRRRLHRHVRHLEDADDRHVGALAPHLRLAEWHQ